MNRLVYHCAHGAGQVKTTCDYCADTEFTTIGPQSCVVATCDPPQRRKTNGARGAAAVSLLWYAALTDWAPRGDPRLERRGPLL